jgi:two-component system response regulator FixJ
MLSYQLAQHARCYALMNHQPPQPQHSSRQKLTSSKIAVVEDDPALADAFAAMLESHGWQADIFLDGEQFIAGLDLNPEPDCILLDLYLPGINGVDVLTALAARHAEIPVIAVTARPDGRLAARALGAGAMVVLTKPVSSDVLVNNIERAMV